MATKRSLVRAALALLVVAICWSALVPVDAKKKKSKSGSFLKGDEKLEKLNGQLENGVIQLTNKIYEKFVRRPDRPYHFFVLYTAMEDRYACEACKAVHPEYFTLAESYITAKQIKVDTRDGLEVFFGIADFETNQEVFGLHGFSSAPHIGYIAPDRNSDEGKRLPSKAEFPAQDMYNLYQQGKKAEDIVEFVKTKTGFDFVIQRSKALLYASVVTVLVFLVVVAKLVLSNFDKVLARLRRKRLWMTVSLLFYGLSVSGMVYCIIREPPAYSLERNGNIKLFNPQGRSQFVVEGLVVGAYDVLAAGFVVLLSQWAVYIQRPILRITAMVLCMAGFVVMYRQMIDAYKYKNRWYTGWMGL